MTHKKEVFEIDNNGYIVEKLLAEFGEDGKPISELASNVIAISPPNGLYRAKWTSVEWVEDMTQAEIDAIKNAPKEPTEIEKLQEKIAMQDMVIEELMFVIIPEITGGGM